jgi:vacuolar-type H+-ATPase subunit B/Vma2
MLGRIFNGRGDPVDGGAPIIPDAYLDVNGNPMNPYSATTRLSSSRQVSPPLTE